MSNTAEASIVFGVGLVDDQKLPWGDFSDYETDFDGDIDEWWRRTNGFETKFDLFTQDYRKEIRDWDDLHPLPVDLLIGGHHETQHYLLAVTGGGQSGDWSSPTIITMAKLFVTTAQIRLLTCFASKYEIQCEGTPGLLLVCSYC